MNGSEHTPEIPPGYQLLTVERVGEGVLITGKPGNATIHIESQADAVRFAHSIISCALYGVSEIDAAFGPSVPEPQRRPGGAS